MTTSTRRADGMIVVIPLVIPKTLYVLIIVNNDSQPFNIFCCPPAAADYDPSHHGGPLQQCLKEMQKFTKTNVDKHQNYAE